MRKITTIEMEVDKAAENPFGYTPNGGDYIPMEIGDDEKIQEAAKQYGVSPELVSDILSAFHFSIDDLKRHLRVDLIDLHMRIEELEKQILD